MELKCLKCGHEKAVKNGFVIGRQRYKCKKCGYQYTKTKPHGYADHERRIVALMYMSGLSMSAIGRFVGISVQTVSRWIRSFYTNKVDELPKIDAMKKLTIKQVKQHFHEIGKEQHENEVFLFSARLASGCGVRILVDSPGKSGKQQNGEGKLTPEFLLNG